MEGLTPQGRIHSLEFLPFRERFTKALPWVASFLLRELNVLCDPFSEATPTSQTLTLGVSLFDQVEAGPLTHDGGGPAPHHPKAGLMVYEIARLVIPPRVFDVCTVLVTCRLPSSTPQTFALRASEALAVKIVSLGLSHGLFTEAPNGGCTCFMGNLSHRWTLYWTLEGSS